MATFRASGFPSNADSKETSCGTPGPSVASLGDLRCSIDLLPMPSSLVEIQTGRILHVNRQAATLMGSDPDDIVGRTATELGWGMENQEHKRLFDTSYEGKGSEFVHGERRLLDSSDPQTTISVRRLRVGDLDCAWLFYLPAPKLIDEATRINIEIENSFRKLVENSVDIILRIDTRGRYLWVSPSVQTILGEDPASLVGTAALAKVHPDDREALEENFRKLAAGSGTTKAVFRHVKDSGEIVWLESVGKAVMDSESGSVMEVLVSSRDITSQKHQEMALRASEFFLSESQRASATGSYRLHLGTGFWDYSQMLGEIFGIGSDFTNTIDGWQDLLHPDDREKMNRYFQDEVLGRRSKFDMTYRIVRRSDGQVRWVHGLGRLVLDEAGNPTQMIGTIRDITEQKMADRQIEELGRFNQTLLDTSGGLIVVLDRDGRVVRFNRACEQLTGWSESELLGRYFFEILVPDDQRPLVKQVFRKLSSGEYPSRFENDWIARDGSRRWIGWVNSVITDEAGDVKFVVGTGLDRTEQRRAEREILELNSTLERKVQERTAELQIAVKELESFSYSISHDLRSPLRAIDGFSLALIEDAGPNLAPELRNYLDRIRSASGHMAHLIDDLLELSRSSRVEIRKSEVDLTLIALEILEGFHNQNPERSLFTKVDPDLRVQGDPVLVRSILDNLLGNSWKYSSTRDETVIEVTSEIVDGRRWVLIRDNGIGFEMEHAAKLFGTFQRLHPGKQFEGTGIGLATVKKLVERHGGAILGAGSPDKGAIFKFTLDPLPESSR